MTSSFAVVLHGRNSAAENGYHSSHVLLCIDCMGHVASVNGLCIFTDAAVLCTTDAKYRPWPVFIVMLIIQSNENISLSKRNSVFISKFCLSTVDVEIQDMKKKKG